MSCRTKQLLDKIVNVYIACDLDAWTRNPTTNFKFKNCYLKNSNKEKYVYSRYGILFDSAGSWSFDNDSAGNVTIFGADNSSSSHSDNRKNIFLILGESLLELMEALNHQKKSLVLILVNQTQSFA